MRDERAEGMRRQAEGIGSALAAVTRQLTQALEERQRLSAAMKARSSLCLLVCCVRVCARAHACACACAKACAGELVPTCALTCARVCADDTVRVSACAIILPFGPLPLPPPPPSAFIGNQ